MADFTININAQPNISYSANNAIRAASSCSPHSENYNIGLTAGLSPVSTVYYLISNYSGSNPYATLKISNIVYSHVTTFYLYDNGIKLLPNTTYDIDISTVLADDTIPGLTFDAVAADLSTGSKTIQFSMQIEDSQGNLGPVVNATIQLQSSGCLQPADTIDINNLIVTDCDTTFEAVVNVIPGQSFYVEITTTGPGVIVVPSITNETITATKSYNVDILGEQPATIGNSVTSKFTITVKPDPSGAIIDGETVTRTHSFNLC